MKKWKKILLAIMLAVIGVISGGIIYLKTQIYAPTESARKITQKAESTNDWVYFSSKDKTEPMIIFYPGALVDPGSYSPWAEKISEAGYPVHIIKMPLDLAVLAPNRGNQVLADHPNRSYVIGGHSLGGVMASRFAEEHPEKLAGVFFLASYPDEKGSLRDVEVPVLSMIAGNDQVLNHEAYQKAKHYLPADTDYQEISGGNHAGFGSYDAQKGDGKSTINNQNEQVAERLVKWLEMEVN